MFIVLAYWNCFVWLLWQISLTGRPGLFLDYMWRKYIVTEAITECVLTYMTSPFIGKRNINDQWIGKPKFKLNEIVSQNKPINSELNSH